MGGTTGKLPRRVALLSLLSVPLFGDDPEQEIFDLFARMAARLSEDNVVEFLGEFDRSMPDYQELRTNVTALLEQSQVQSSVTVLRNEGTATERTVELDWFMQITERYDTQAVTRRRELVRCTVRKTGKKWKVSAFAPLALFAPVHVNH
jgi:hypothetical protein